MKTKFSPTVVGLFVVGALILGVGALLTFGGVNFFSKPLRFVVSFNESIHGLDLGSPVKLRGVRVGRVVGLNVRYDDKINRSVVRVLCELNSDVVKDDGGNVIDVSSREEFQRLVDQGLRAQLGVQSFATGMLFVALDFFNPQEYPADTAPPDAKYSVVPAVPSAISEFQAGATDIISNLKKIDFAGISKGLTGLLADTRKKIDGVDAKTLVDQWTRTGASIDALAKSPEIKDTLANLNAAAIDLRATLSKLDTQIGPAGENLNTTLVEAKKAMESFNATAITLQRFVSNQSGLGEDFSRTLAQIAEAAESVNRLAEFLERNPNALLTGKKRP